MSGVHPQSRHPNYKASVFCPYGSRKGLRVESGEVQMPWCQDITWKKRKSKVYFKVLDLGDVLRSLNLPALAKWKGGRRNGGFRAIFHFYLPCLGTTEGNHILTEVSGSEEACFVDQASLQFGFLSDGIRQIIVQASRAC